MDTLLLLLMALVAFTAWVGVLDARSGHIPNRLLLVGFALGVLGHAAVYLSDMHQRSLGQALSALGFNVLAGLLLCGAVPFLLFRLNAMGGGDVKLLAVVGASVGPLLGMELELYAFVLLALFAPARLAYRGQLLSSLANSVALFVNPLLPEARRRPVPRELLTPLPFGPAVCAASVLVAVLYWRGA
ncbi:MAG: A24 family peptidase [Polyangiaceae bacterium]